MKTALPQMDVIEPQAPPRASTALKERFLQRLFEPVGLEPLVFFRIAFGLLILAVVVRYLYMGWVPSVFVTPKYHFTYTGFEWVKPWPQPGMTIHFAVLG